MTDNVTYTARNSGRSVNGRADYGRADKYVPGAYRKLLEESRQSRLTNARAMREAQRLLQQLDVASTGTPYQRGCLRILTQLRAVREAHSLDALYQRDQVLSYLIGGAGVFDCITPAATARLQLLRDNAFTLRHKELSHE